MDSAAFILLEGEGPCGFAFNPLWFYQCKNKIPGLLCMGVRTLSATHVNTSVSWTEMHNKVRTHSESILLETQCRNWNNKWGKYNTLLREEKKYQKDKGNFMEFHALQLCCSLRCTLEVIQIRVKWCVERISVWDGRLLLSTTRWEPPSCPMVPMQQN